ncbi:MAG: radical SAM protein [Dehalococcoidia bacterium]
MKTESIYWVYTHNCNLKCAHCYNFSRPGAPTVSRAEADAVLANLPRETNRFILSGGEPLVELEMALYLLAAGRDRYPHANVSLQTNGDLLDAATLERLLATGLDGIAICSLDAFHPRPDGKFDALRELMTGQGMVERQVGDPAAGKQAHGAPSFSIWGASPELWVGGLWPRGRAMKYGLAQMMPDHNFCDRWSGALGFLDNGSAQQEVAIQFTTAYPCCPGTVEPLGDLASELLEAMLDRRRDDPVWQALNAGDPAAMGIAAGFDREHALRRIEELGSVCLWCDEFFTAQARRRGHEVAPLPLMGELAEAER